MAAAFLVCSLGLLAGARLSGVRMCEMSGEEVFDAQIRALRAWRQRVGHADVPLGSALGRWVYSQRRLREQAKLAPERVEALDALGLRWKIDPDDVPWEEMVDRFRAFYAEYGHGRVPKKYEVDPLLGAWVAVNRRRNKTLAEAKRQELTACGFDWSPPAARCGSQFMVGFREWVTARESGSAPDERWEETQRAARRKGKLSEVRIEYLDGAGFDWRGADSQEVEEDVAG